MRIVTVRSCKAYLNPIYYRDKDRQVLALAILFVECKQLSPSAQLFEVSIIHFDTVEGPAVMNPRKPSL